MTALVRSPSDLETRDRVTLIEGDVLDPDSVGETVKGTDAVVCMLGRTPNNPDDIVSRGTEQIIDAMTRHDVRRLVVLTSMGLGTSVRQVPWYVRVVTATLLHDLMADKARQEELVMRSNLDWTIVRPGGLTDGPYTEEYVHGVNVDATAGPISRANVAAFLLRIVRENGYIRETPVLTTRDGVTVEFLREQATSIATRLRQG